MKQRLMQKKKTEKKKRQFRSGVEGKTSEPQRDKCEGID